MDYRNSTGSIMVGIGFALMFSLMNGLSTRIFDGQTVSDKALGWAGVA